MGNPRTRSWAGIALALALLLHLLGVYLFLPARGEIFNDDPIAYWDYPLHFYQAFSAIEHLKASGRTWGYDPHLMAGYPNNTVYDVGYKLNELWVAAFSFLGLGRAYKILVYLSFLLPPFLIFAAARKFGLPFRESAAAAIATVFFWRLDNTFNGTDGGVAGFVGFGMFTFALACFLAVLFVAVFYRYTREGRMGDLILLFLLAPLLVLLHLFSALIVALPLLIIAIAFRPKRVLPYAAALILCAAWTLALNLFWIRPFLAYRHWTTGNPANLQNFAITLQYFLVRGGARALPFLLFFSLIGLSRRDRFPRALAAALAAGAVFLLLLSTVGAGASSLIASMEPHRFLGPAKVLLLVPAAAGALSALSPVRSRALRALLLLGACALLIAHLPSTGRLRAGYPERAWAFIELLREKTDPSARVLIQDSDPRHPGQFFGSHVPFLRLHLDREQIGGFYGFVPLRHSFADFSYNFLFGRDLEDFPPPELERYLDLYNVKWIVAWSDLARNYFHAYPGLRQIAKKKRGREDYLYLFEREAAPGFLVAGKGEVRADYDRIVIDRASPGEIVLRYHWMEGMRAEPETPLEPVRLLDDPVPFIRLVNPGHDRIVIRTD